MPTALQLIIIGNGFDLHCGLKSSYRSFFRQTILDTIGEGFGLIQKKPGVKGFWEDLLIEHYKTDSKKDYEWCEIEAIIKETLWLTCFGESKSSDDLTLNKGIWQTALCRKSHGEDFVSRRIAGPIQNFIFCYCCNFFDSLGVPEKDFSTYEKLGVLLEHLLCQLHSLEIRFCKYLKDNIVNLQDTKELNTEYIVNAANLLAKLAGLSESFANLGGIISQEEKLVTEQISPNQSVAKYKKVNVLSKVLSKLKYTHILSFNYTALFDILSVESPCSYSNVHGKLCMECCKENCDSSNIIFGMDDTLISSKKICNILRSFSKTYRKMFATDAPTSILPPNDYPVDIIFYGHSLSEADYSYFQSIFDYYNLYSNNKVHLIFYYSSGYEQTDEIYSLINSYGQSLSNQEQGKNLIHKLLLENRLSIRKLD